MHRLKLRHLTPLARLGSFKPHPLALPRHLTLPRLGHHLVGLLVGRADPQPPPLGLHLQPVPRRPGRLARPNQFPRRCLTPKFMETNWLEFKSKM